MCARACLRRRKGSDIVKQALADNGQSSQKTCVRLSLHAVELTNFGSFSGGAHCYSFVEADSNGVVAGRGLVLVRGRKASGGADTGADTGAGTGAGAGDGAGDGGPLIGGGGATVDNGGAAGALAGCAASPTGGSAQPQVVKGDGARSVVMVACTIDVTRYDVL